jgi:hypothetical protein
MTRRGANLLAGLAGIAMLVTPAWAQSEPAPPGHRHGR